MAAILHRSTSTDKPMDIVTSVDELRSHAWRWRSRSARIAFVPTMGNLHAGHVKLVELDGEDHWLSSSETRLATLKAIEKFISKNL